MGSSLVGFVAERFVIGVTVRDSDLNITAGLRSLLRTIFLGSWFDYGNEFGFDLDFRPCQSPFFDEGQSIATFDCAHQSSHDKAKSTQQHGSHGFDRNAKFDPFE